MKILLTGCRGQLGQALSKTLGNHELVGTDAAELDICDADAVDVWMDRETPALVINAAAYTRVDDAESNQELAWKVNAEGPRNLALATERSGATLLHLSTDYVFDGRGSQPLLESDMPNPQSVYGESKLAGEKAVQAYASRYFIVRTAWLYHSSGKNFLRTMHDVAEQGEVRVVDDQTGSPTNADDLADALAILIATRDYGIWHLANAGEASWYQLTCEFYRQMGIDVPVIPVPSAEFPRAAERPAWSVLGSEHTPPIGLPSWQKGVARLVAEIKASGWG